MGSLKVCACVFRGTTISIDELGPMFFGHPVEVRLVVGRGQALCELLPDWRESIIGFVA